MKKKGECDISYCVDLLYKCELYRHILSPILRVFNFFFKKIYVYLDYVDRRSSNSNLTSIFEI